jgi:hypothetical protein
MKLMKFDQIFEAGTQSVVDQAKNYTPGGGYKSKEDFDRAIMFTAALFRDKMRKALKSFA